MKIRFLLVSLLLALVFTGAVFAQGVQTATLQGTVTDQSGTPLPGVTVTAKSPALMGERTTVTQTTGDYNLPGLPPGPGGLKQTVAAVRRAFPDLHYTIEDIVLGGDKAALRVTMRGTHRGEFLSAWSAVGQSVCAGLARPRRS